MGGRSHRTLQSIAKTLLLLEVRWKPLEDFEKESDMV